jgi:hypothetical protein
MQSERTLSLVEEPMRIVRFAFGLGIFALIGPPVGGLIYVAMVLAFRGSGYDASGALIAVLLFSYPLGIVFALPTGLIVGIASVWWKKESWAVSLLAAIAVNLAAVIPIALMNTEQFFMVTNVTNFTMIFLPPSLGASLVCWRLSRRVWNPT